MSGEAVTAMRDEADLDDLPSCCGASLDIYKMLLLCNMFESFDVTRLTDRREHCRSEGAKDRRESMMEMRKSL